MATEVKPTIRIGTIVKDRWGTRIGFSGKPPKRNKSFPRYKTVYQCDTGWVWCVGKGSKYEVTGELRSWGWYSIVEVTTGNIHQADLEGQPERWQVVKKGTGTFPVLPPSPPRDWRSNAQRQIDDTDESEIQSKFPDIGGRREWKRSAAIRKRQLEVSVDE